MLSLGRCEPNLGLCGCCGCARLAWGWMVAEKRDVCELDALVVQRGGCGLAVARWTVKTSRDDVGTDDWPADP